METEIWKAHPGIPGIEVSTLGRVRTLDRVVSTEKMTRFQKGRVLKQRDNGRGYLIVNIPINGKQVTKKVHRLVAQTFIPNSEELPQVNLAAHVGLTVAVGRIGQGLETGGPLPGKP